MARYSGPKCRLCRRENTKLYLKGTRCETDKCALTRRQTAPGQHGNSGRRSSTTQFGTQLREKQKLKRLYGLLEKQFGLYVSKAFKLKGVASENLVQLLESRLDNVVYRCGFATSRSEARQFIRRGLFSINNVPVNIPSQIVKPGDIVRPVSFEKLHLRESYTIPNWLNANVSEKYVKIDRLPEGDELKVPVNTQLIVEYYSR
ncbi:30S ribosomal protein S4 [bacterium]|jgi:small subunit ribosomal protein S4|nr:30S ribosomal protein S4 [bacterium]